MFDLMVDVMDDENSRLPYVPTFYRTMKPEVEEEFLNTTVPKVHEARGEEFCLSACAKEGQDCMST